MSSQRIVFIVCALLVSILLNPNQAAGPWDSFWGWARPPSAIPKTALVPSTTTVTASANAPTDSSSTVQTKWPSYTSYSHYFPSNSYFSKPMPQYPLQPKPQLAVTQVKPPIYPPFTPYSSSQPKFNGFTSFYGSGGSSAAPSIPVSSTGESDSTKSSLPVNGTEPTDAEKAEEARNATIAQTQAQTAKMAEILAPAVNESMLAAADFDSKILADVKNYVSTVMDNSSNATMVGTKRLLNATQGAPIEV